MAAIAKMLDPRFAAIGAPAEPGPEPLAPIAMPDASPMPAMTSTAPMVRQPSPLENQIQHEQQKLQKIQFQQDHPWGTAENHPGVGGKIAHVLSVAGNIAGDIVAPNVMARIPGTQMNRNAQESQTAERLDKEQQELSQIQAQGAQTRQAEAKANALENPAMPEEGKPYTMFTDHGALQWDGQHWAPIQVNGETVNQPDKPGSPVHLQRAQGSYVDPHTGKTVQALANYDPVKGVYTDQQGNVIPNFKPADKSQQGAYGSFGPAFLAYRMLNSAYNENPALLPYIAPLISKMLAQSGGEVPGMQDALGTTPAGQPRDASGTPIGLRMPEAPTGATRSRGQFAESVLPSMTDAESQIKSLRDDLGPLAGRYNELATSKIGAFGPKFTGLQTTLHNIATAWMRLHANSDAARKDFIDQLRAAQDPDNLLAALNSIEKQATDYAKEGKGRPDSFGSNEPKHEVSNSKEPPRPANVPEGYKFNAHGPKGAGWYAPTAK